MRGGAPGLVLKGLTLVVATAAFGCRPAPPPPPPPAASAAAPSASAAAAAETAPPAAAGASGQGETPAEGPDHHGADAQALRLDAGKRWKATPATTAGIGRMKALASAVDPATVTDVAALHGLGDKLQAELDGIIATCTMTGEAHEQLHVYLTPLYAEVARLRQGSLPEAREAATSVRSTLAEYDAYFE